MKKILSILIVLIAIGWANDANAQDKLFVTYNTATPIGKTSDFISKQSWRGFSIEPRWEIGTDNYIGLRFSWQVYYESQYGSFTEGTRTVTGTQYRYINAYPIQLTGFKNLDVGSSGNQIYLGAGIGSTKVDQRRDFGLYSIYDNQWRFSLSPEIGFIVNNSFANDFVINIKYDYAFKANESEPYSGLIVGIGFAL